MFHVKLLVLFFLFFSFTGYSQHMGSSIIEVKQMPVLPIIPHFIINHLNQFKESEELSEKQKEWFYWTNYSRENPKRFWDSVIAPLVVSFPNLNNSYSISLKSDLYNSTPLPLVKPNLSLNKVSGKLADQLASKNAAPSHTSPQGYSFEDRMKEAAIKLCAGENISFGPDNPALMLVLLYIDEGVPDMGHRKTLLNPQFVEMGIGVSSYPDKKLMIIQEFACTQQ